MTAQPEPQVGLWRKMSRYNFLKFKVSTKNLDKLCKEFATDKPTLNNNAFSAISLMIDLFVHVFKIVVECDNGCVRRDTYMIADRNASIA